MMLVKAFTPYEREDKRVWKWYRKPFHNFLVLSMIWMLWRQNFGICSRLPRHIAFLINRLMNSNIL